VRSTHTKIFENIATTLCKN